MARARRVPVRGFRERDVHVRLQNLVRIRDRACLDLHAGVTQRFDRAIERVAHLIIEQVGLPNLKSLCDITNYYILGSDVAEAVRRVGPMTIHCHLKGVVGKFPYNHFLVPGERGDEFPFDDFAKALGEVGYTGCIQ